MKTTIAVFFGGASVEHEVSIISAVQAMNYINRDKYYVIPVYITKSGEFLSGESLFKMDTYRDMKNLFKSVRKVTLERESGTTYVKAVKGKIFGKKSIPVSVAFPIVHGTNCEDGSLQGFFEVLQLAYIGCDVMSSAVGMDKSVFKSVMKSSGLPVLDCLNVTAREWFSKKEDISKEICDKIGYPLIVKPVNLGSSVGISKVSDENELIEAMELACSFAERILIEKAVVSLREINCSVLGDINDCEASVCEEPFAHDKILSYEDKYMSNSSSKGMSSLQRKLPADISEEKSKEIRDLAKNVFCATGCSGVSRIDFLMDTADNDKIYVNEINTIPGSLAFYLWEASGIKYPELIDRLVDIAFRRQRTRENLMFTIDTNLLASAGNFGAKGSKGSKF